MKKHHILHLLLLTICLLLPACRDRSSTDSHIRKAGTKAVHESLRIGVLPTMDCLPLYVALHDSLYRKVGVEVELVAGKSQLDHDTAFVGGSIDGMMTDIERVRHLQKQGVSVHTLGSTAAGWQLIGNKRARITAVKQLGSKMVAMTRHSATDRLTDEVLRGVKTQGDVFRVQFNDIQLRLKMLENNAMDALWLPEPQATTARLMGHKVLYDTEKNKTRWGVLGMRNRRKNNAKERKETALLIKAYNMAVDSIAKYGVQHYEQLIMDYTGSTSGTVRRLPAIRYTHIR